MSRTITHTVKDGFCTTCGETLAWLTERGMKYTIVTETPAAVYAVTDPNGITHTKKIGTKKYTHAVIRQNKGTDHYFVNWATSKVNADKESRVFKNQRSYIQVVEL